MSRAVIIATVLTAYLAAGMVAAAYLAGAAFFVLNKTIPDAIAIDTWYRYWHAYAADPLQHRRLLLSAAIAAAALLAPPLCALGALAHGQRSLHGDARWASEREIREAGLL